jgi:DNA polymerase-3 subunit delta
MSVEKIIGEWKRRQFKPVYWLEGEEEYYINKLVDYAEHSILDPSEASFNLTVFYGKDADWAAVINACRRYPMNADRQVVLLKEAQQMRDIDKLEPYIQNPLTSTVLVVSHKEKKFDGRSKLAKLLKEKGEILTTKKMYDSQLPEWTQDLIRSKGFAISQKALMLLIDHVGNDLTRLDHEIEKLSVNLSGTNQITEDDIEKYIGISKEYNVFELQDALVRRDASKALRIVQYFEANPKAGPIQMVLPALYGFFSKVYMLFGLSGEDEKTMASRIGVNPFFIKDYLLAAKNYKANGVENAILLLHQYNLKSIGVNSPPVDDGSLMKEMIAKVFISEEGRDPAR